MKRFVPSLERTQLEAHSTSDYTLLARVTHFEAPPVYPELFVEAWYPGLLVEATPVYPVLFDSSVGARMVFPSAASHPPSTDLLTEAQAGQLHPELLAGHATPPQLHPAVANAECFGGHRHWVRQHHWEPRRPVSARDPLRV